MNSEKNTIFHFIQIARCFAALLVVADHALLDYNGIYDAPNKHTEQIAWRLGNFGVYIFFIISGFVITVGNLDNFGRGKTRDFLIKRFIRIVPMYWAVTLVYILRLSTKGIEVAWPNILTSILFIPYGCFHDACGRPVLELGWTLQFEMFFYLLFAAALCFHKSVAMPILIIGLATLTLMGWHLNEAPLPLGYYLDPILIYFLSGLLLGLFVNSTAYTQFNAVLSRVGMGAYTCILIVVLALAIAMIVTAQADKVVYVEFVFAVSFILLCLRYVSESELVGKSFKVGAIKLLLLLGAASYSLYFTHIFLLGIAVKLTKMLPFHLPFPLYFSMLAIAAIALSIIVYWSFEKPSQKILNRLFNSGQRSK
jgi:exopolysaccharide production protein ExoZ